MRFNHGLYQRFTLDIKNLGEWAWQLHANLNIDVNKFCFQFVDGKWKRKKPLSINKLVGKIHVAAT